MGEFRTKYTQITGLEDITEEIKKKYQLHDWSLEYLFCNGKDARITFQTYEKDEMLFRFYLYNLLEYDISVDLVEKWLYEVNIEKRENSIYVIFDGVGIEIEATDLMLEIQEHA